MRRFTLQLGETKKILRIPHHDIASAVFDILNKDKVLKTSPSNPKIDGSNPQIDRFNSDFQVVCL